MDKLLSSWWGTIPSLFQPRFQPKNLNSIPEQKNSATQTVSHPDNSNNRVQPTKISSCTLYNTETYYNQPLKINHIMHAKNLQKTTKNKKWYLWWSIYLEKVLSKFLFWGSGWWVSRFWERAFAVLNIIIGCFEDGGENVCEYAEKGGEVCSEGCASSLYWSKNIVYSGIPSRGHL